MKKNFSTKIVVLLTTILTTAFIFVGCDSLDDAKHNSDTSRDGVSGYSMTMTINPSRVPANDNATMQANIRFFRTKDRAPVGNTLVRLKIDTDYSYEYLDPGIVRFSDNTLMTDVITNAAGEASVTIYVGSLGRSVPELLYRLDAQGTVEYEKWNTLIYTAQEFFWIYNPHWDGSLPPDTIKPTAIIVYFPSAGIQIDTEVTFYGGDSYDRGQATGADNPWDSAKAYGEIRSYKWVIDGAAPNPGPASGATITHKFKTVGAHDVSLMVTDDEGMIGVASEPIQVGATPVPTSTPAPPPNTPTPTPTPTP